jgi:hypothetical protein
MAFLQPDPGDPGEDRAAAGTVGGPEIQLERRLITDGLQVIARGSLICPDCELPLPGRPSVRASALLECAWCGHSAPARDLLRVDVRDTESNRVALVARLVA